VRALEIDGQGAVRIEGLPGGVVAGFSTRRLAPDGLPAAVAHRRLADALGMPTAETVRVRQVHGRVALQAVGEPRPGRDAVLGEADALISDRQGRLLGIQTADCVPILLVDRAGIWMAAVHAGWRGTALRIVDVVLDLLLARGVEPGALTAVFGPSIGGTLYEVGPEVVAALRDAYSGTPVPDGTVRNGTGDRSWLDVAAYNRAALVARGVPGSGILDVGLCTAGRPDLFPSYRRDGSGTGRVVTTIGRV
jgi:YfiH family protein